MDACKLEVYVERRLVWACKLEIVCSNLVQFSVSCDLVTYSGPYSHYTLCISRLRLCASGLLCFPHLHVVGIATV